MAKRSAWILFFAITFIVFGVVVCEKYGNKILFNWQSKPEQLARNWMIAGATISGKDITSNYDQFVLKLTEKGEANLLAKFKQKQANFDYKTIGSWFLMNNQNKILLDFENNEADVVYHILNLKDGEIWLKKEDEPLELHFVSE